MKNTSSLTSLLSESASRYPDRVAVVEPGRAKLDYAELANLSDQIRDRLLHIGVRAGDRVGIYHRKSVDSIACIFGILKAGAAYVPVDPDAPVRRCASVLSDCSVRAVFTEPRLENDIRSALKSLGSSPVLLHAVTDAHPVPIRSFLDDEQRLDPAPASGTAPSTPDDLAYILYTSGSTGQPKGVMLAHRAALCFIDWCSSVFRPGPLDVVSSHAPLHFDLSIHDVFVAIKHGARLVLIGEDLGRDPLKLAEVIAREKISIWYSTPSILGLLANYGKLHRYDYSALRLVLFAGEVFPIPPLRAIKAAWPEARYFNLYGPTETNVCTYYEIPERVPEERTEPFPIGRMCPPLRGRVVDEAGADVFVGEEGELVVSGPGVMDGYWNQPERNAMAFIIDEAHGRWYRTGDIVAEQDDGVYVFHGRCDRMIKRRGYRIELGEIEAGLAAYPDIQEVAVVAIPAAGAGTHIRAFLSTRNACKPSIIELKQFSARVLPRYMVPDTFQFVDALPRTSTNKIDYQNLRMHL